MATKHVWKKLGIAALALAGGFGALRGYFYVTHDFRIANITCDIPRNPAWMTQELAAEDENALDKVLSQRFTYLGKGAQSYAFSSEDGRYVLKFFKYKHLTPNFISRLIPPVGSLADYRKQIEERKARQFKGVFDGYKLASDVHKNESGILFVQLIPSGKRKIVTLIDKVGFERSVDLGTVAFILQEKGKTTANVLKEHLKQGDVASVKKRISQIFDLYLSEYEKGIYDRDHGVMHNTGFVGEKPIHLDVGKLTRNEDMKIPQIHHQDLVAVAAKIDTWMHAYYPQYAMDVREELQQKLSAVSGSPFAFSK